MKCVNFQFVAQYLNRWCRHWTNT